MWRALFFFSSGVQGWPCRGEHVLFSLEYIIVSSNLSRRTRAWFACSRRRHALKRRSELGRFSVYGDDLHKVASACASRHMYAVTSLRYLIISADCCGEGRVNRQGYISWLLDFIIPCLTRSTTFGVSASKHCSFPISTPYHCNCNLPSHTGVSEQYRQ
jgi:hypothetical protein